MNARLALAAALLVQTVHAFPPAPFHTIYGSLRDEHGNPLRSGAATVILSGDTGEIVRSPSDPSIAAGVNYTLHVPMDAGTLAQLYQPTAMRPTMPFTIRVVIGANSYVPIEIVGKSFAVGKPGATTRLDLTLGEDSDKDGLPDAWERDLIDTDPNDDLRTLADVTPNGDADGDGLSNLDEYRAGTYALDKLDGVRIDVVDFTDGVVRLRFLAVTGRTYRIRSSADGKVWNDQGYSFETTGTDAVLAHLATETRVVDVFVKWAEPKRGFFQLSAE